MMRRRVSFSARALVGLSAAILAMSVAGCAPEPAQIAGQPEKGAENTDTGSSWSQPTGDIDAEAKTTELPETFPREQFPIPTQAVIDDAGARSDSAWFVVLRAADTTEAAVFWSEIVALGGFAESDTSETPEGGRAGVLTSANLSVVAVTIPQDDGAVLMSFDVSAAAG